MSPDKTISDLHTTKKYRN